jgi:hypothetical protein
MAYFKTHVYLDHYIFQEALKTFYDPYLTLVYKVFKTVAELPLLRADIFVFTIGALKAVKIHIAVFPVMIPCSSGRYQCFGGKCCLHLQDRRKPGWKTGWYTEEKGLNFTSVPFFSNTFSCISKHNMRSVGLPPKKISHFLPFVKEDLALKTLHVYSIS